METGQDTRSRVSETVGTYRLGVEYRRVSAVVRRFSQPVQVLPWQAGCRAAKERRGELSRGLCQYALSDYRWFRSSFRHSLDISTKHKAS